MKYRVELEWWKIAVHEIDASSKDEARQIVNDLVSQGLLRPPQNIRHTPKILEIKPKE